MNSAILQFICSQHASLSRLPMRLYSGSVLMENFEPEDRHVDFFEAVYSSMLENGSDILYHATHSFLLFGLVRDASENLALILGPVAIIPLNEFEIRNIIVEHKLGLDKIPLLDAYLKGAPNMSLDNFISCLRIYYAIINNRIAALESLISPNPDYELNLEVNSSFAKTSEGGRISADIRHSSYEFESRLLFYVSHGMVEQLKAMTTNTLRDAVGRTSIDTLRHLKNIILIQNSLVSRAAIRGGLSSKAAYQLAEIYAQKIDRCSSSSELQTISTHLRLDYCKRVRDLQYTDFNDFTINKAIMYICDHVSKKLTAGDIAAHLGISREYLSTKFKTVTKTTVTDFINRQKIREAEYLLLYTNNSLAAISDYLSFSSQSYFQNVFKKYAGCTPSEYRIREKSADSLSDPV